MLLAVMVALQAGARAAQVPEEGVDVGQDTILGVQAFVDGPVVGGHLQVEAGPLDGQPQEVGDEVADHYAIRVPE